MKVYNTLTKRVQPFVPKVDNKVSIYTCGPTVYHYAHIGNLRTYIFEDILEKTLIYLGYDVKRVMNITDVGHMTSDSDHGEDKMLAGAKRENKTVWEIADYYTEAFFKDIEKLNIKKPEIISRATDNIDYYIKMISKLIEDGYAYISNGNVYFDTSKSKNYYELSGMNPEDLLEGARVDVEVDEFKKNPADFGLWFTTSKFENQDMKWDSPWGVGYPGWHIECSGIAIRYLGKHVDIHCGGIDNIFPHHTNEIAQSESFLGHKWCNYWMHGAHLIDETGKMSKSKGEFLTLSKLEEKGYDPLIYRYLCLGSHYRNHLMFSYSRMDTSKSAYEKLKNRVKGLKADNNGDINKELVEKYQSNFKDALKDDLNTSNALTVLYDVLKDENLNDSTKLYLVKDFDQVLSLSLIENKEKTISEELVKIIEEKIKERKVAKENRDFETSDKIRDELYEMGIIIKDTKDGTIYELKN